MSVIQNWFGPSRSNSRFTRSTVVAWSIRFGLPLRRAVRPAIPSSRMIDWISFSLTRWPYASSSSARTRRHPYVRARPVVYLPDHIGEPPPPDRPIPRQHAAPPEESRRRNAEQSTYPFGAVALTSQHLHDAEQRFWAHHPALREQLRRVPHRRKLGLELHCRSSRGAQSAVSEVAVPASSPRSTRSWRTHRYTVASATSRTRRRRPPAFPNGLAPRPLPGTATHMRAASNPPNPRTAASLATQVQKLGDRSAGPPNGVPSGAPRVEASVWLSKPTMWAPSTSQYPTTRTRRRALTVRRAIDRPLRPGRDVALISRKPWHGPSAFTAQGSRRGTTAMGLGPSRRAENPARSAELQEAADRRYASFNGYPQPACSWRGGARRQARIAGTDGSRLCMRCARP